jgi:uncharacterized membrane protein YeaQ/YmgE (transglycosylase-associated protein family)
VTITGIITAIIVGAIIGVLGRLVTPGSQSVPIWLTILIGILAAFIGTFLAAAVGISTSTPGIDWGELLTQVILAASGTTLVANISARSGSGRTAREDQQPPPRPSHPEGRGPGPVHPVVAQQRPMVNTVRQQTKIFISYRRSDSAHAARGVADRLRTRFGAGEVFMDVDSIDPGIDFLQGVQQAIRGSAVVLVLIGEHWLDARDSRRIRRLDDPDDNVRMEIEQALRHRCRILPILIDQAVMPHPQELPPTLIPLPRFNAVRVRHDSWDDDVAKLTQAVSKLRS